MQPKREFPPNASLVFEGKLVDVYQWPQTMFDGTIQTFEAVSRCDSAGVILVDDMGRIGINRQEQPHRPPFLSLYGGRIESNEEPLL
ncbi:MAG TPA: hypothetical protein PK765_01980 [bacterium]|nr:hypothetical protein [bacterium]